MQIETGCVVLAAAGHDAPGAYAVVAVEKGYVLLADGRRRPLEKPKRKSVKHIRKTNTRLDLSSIDTNKKLRESLSAFARNEGGSLLV